MSVYFGSIFFLIHPVYPLAIQVIFCIIYLSIQNAALLTKMQLQLRSCLQLDPEIVAVGGCLGPKIHDFRSNRALFFLYEKNLKRHEQLNSFQVHMLEVSDRSALKVKVEVIQP